MVFWPGELHSPWGRKEWDTTERLSLRSTSRSPLSPSVTFLGAHLGLPSLTHAPLCPVWGSPAPPAPKAPAFSSSLTTTKPAPTCACRHPISPSAGAYGLPAAPPHLGPCPRLPACSDTSVFSAFQLWVQPLVSEPMTHPDYMF